MTEKLTFSSASFSLKYSASVVSHNRAPVTGELLLVEKKPVDMWPLDVGWNSSWVSIFSRSDEAFLAQGSDSRYEGPNDLKAIKTHQGMRTIERRKQSCAIKVGWKILSQVFDGEFMKFFQRGKRIHISSRRLFYW